MGMTMTQKILARAAGLSQVEAGQLLEAAMSVEPTPVENAPRAP